MEDMIKQVIFRLFPEMQHGLHVPSYAVVKAVPDSISDGQLADDFEPGYAVDVRMLDKDGEEHGPVIERVPLPVPYASNNRGQFAYPLPDTLVMVQYLYGDPERPVITSIYPRGMHLPALKERELLLQQSAATYMRGTDEENWDIRARNKIRLGNEAVDVISELHKLASLLAGHAHPGVGAPTNAVSISAVASQVAQVKT